MQQKWPDRSCIFVPFCWLLTEMIGPVNPGPSGSSPPLSACDHVTASYGGGSMEEGLPSWTAHWLCLFSSLSLRVPLRLFQWNFSTGHRTRVLPCIRPDWATLFGVFLKAVACGYYYCQLVDGLHSQLMGRSGVGVAYRIHIII